MKSVPRPVRSLIQQAGPNDRGYRTSAATTTTAAQNPVVGFCSLISGLFRIPQRPISRAKTRDWQGTSPTPVAPNDFSAIHFCTSVGRCFIRTEACVRQDEPTYLGIVRTSTEHYAHIARSQPNDRVIRCRNEIGPSPGALIDPTGRAKRERIQDQCRGDHNCGPKTD